MSRKRVNTSVLYELKVEIKHNINDAKESILALTRQLEFGSAFIRSSQWVKRDLQVQKTELRILEKRLSRIQALINYHNTFRKGGNGNDMLHKEGYDTKTN
jgi:hypothetical protein